MEPEKPPHEREEDLIRLLVPDWRPTPRQVVWATRLVFVLGVLVAIGYAYGITLWDWMKLLVVPAVIAGGGLWFNTQQREREQQTAHNRSQDETLQAYLDGMAELLTDKDRPLHRAEPGDSLSTVARARTLTVLGRLDGGRKRSVLEFLYEAGLIHKEQTLPAGTEYLIETRHCIVSLQRADLSGAELRGANLNSADLTWVRLLTANLRRALLIRADLSWASLSEADLSEWTCVGSVDCLRLRTVRGKESIATNKPCIPTGVSPRSYPAG